MKGIKRSNPDAFFSIQVIHKDTSFIFFIPPSRIVRSLFLPFFESLTLKPLMTFKPFIRVVLSLLKLKEEKAYT